MHYADRLVRVLARMGYAARGAIYLLVGALALPAAFGLEGSADTRGALKLVLAQEYGEPVLLVIAAGLVGYAAWRILQAVLDVDAHGWGVKGVCLRAAFLISAMLYLGVAVLAVKLALSIDQDNGSSSPVRDLAAQLLAWPGGRWLIGAAGVSVVVAGVAHLYKAAVGGFRKWFVASAAAMRWIDPVSRFGLAARGLLFMGAGSLIMYAAKHVEPSMVVGLRGALDWLQTHAYRQWTLAAAGVGLMAFGVYSLIEAVVRRVGLRP